MGRSRATSWYRAAAVRVSSRKSSSRKFFIGPPDAAVRYHAGARGQVCCLHSTATATPSARPDPFVLRLHHDLDGAVFLVVEHLEGRGGLVERDAVRDHEAGVDLAALDAVQERLQVAMHRGL